MEDKELEELQQEMYKNIIEVPEEIENAISDLSKEVATKLFYRPDTAYPSEFYDNKYIFAAGKVIKSFKEYIILKVLDVTDEKHPRKFRVESEIDNKFSYRENLQATVECFLRDRCGYMDNFEVDGN